MSRSLDTLAILLVDTHRESARTIIEYLEHLGANTTYAADIPQARALLRAHHYDLILLDEDSQPLHRHLRHELARATPVILLTGQDRPEGFSGGADDYLLKPLALPALAARIQALAHRDTAPSVLTVADLELDPARQAVRRGGTVLKLSPTAFRILHILMRETPNVVSRAQLEQALWGDLVPDSDALRSHLYNLRKVIDTPFDVALMETRPGIGFLIRDPAP